MKKMDVNEILLQLEETEKALECNACTNRCVEPVRLKVCGHYFCLKCLRLIQDRICPKCKMIYEEKEVDHDNMARQTMDILSELRVRLKDNVFYNSPSFDNDEHNVVYEGKIYHMNYIDEVNNKVNAKGETSLHVACRKRNVEHVKQLIDKESNLNTKDFAGWAPLHEAVQSNTAEIVEILLQHGALIDIPGPDYETPLHKAVLLENEKIVKLLLNCGANKELINYFGRKPVDCTKNENISRILLESNSITKRTEELFCKKRISVYFYYTENSCKAKIHDHKLVKIEKEYDSKKVTHFIIKRNHKLSVKILCAMLDGCFIVPQEWLDDFLNESYFIPIPRYVFISNQALNLGMQRALMNSLLKRPKLFDGINFFICGHFSSVDICNLKLTKASISGIICAGGGKMLHRAPTVGTCENVVSFPYHSDRNSRLSRCGHYIIYDEANPPKLQYQMAEIKHKSSRWLVECVINFRIAD